MKPASLLRLCPIVVALIGCGITRADSLRPRLLSSRPDSGQTVRLAILPSGATRRTRSYFPQRIQLSTTPPRTLKKAPPGLIAPLYGVLEFGPREHPASYIVIVDEPDGKPARLFVDTKGDGDLTNDPPAEWVQSQTDYKTTGALPHKWYLMAKQYPLYRGGAMLLLPGSGKTVRIGLYRFDKHDPYQSDVKDALLYYADYARTGRMRLGSKTYDVMLYDILTTGDFRGTPTFRAPVKLLIDVNGNGRFNEVGEWFDASQPFNVEGTTYEITGMDSTGGRFKVIQASRVNNPQGENLSPAIQKALTQKKHTQ